jgi:hypothetical protein
MTQLIKRRKSVLFIAAPLVILAAIIGSLLTHQTSDATVNGWQAGNIIGDGVFTNKNTMNASTIQSFLVSKVPSCDTWGTQTSEYGGGTRRQWAEAHGYSAPFTCMRDYSENGKSAAQLIYDASQKYSINPQVLLVLLQKEQGLVTDTWPLSIQYRSATGYGCPDSAACDSQYYGLTNQLEWAAKMFRAIMNDSPTWFTPYVLGDNTIKYNPDSSCGSSNVYIQNRATQALYNYTPYQPNQGALNADWGTAPCGSYGNRNFYLYFTSWFGSTRDVFVGLTDPRWMRLKVDTYKKNTGTGENVEGLLPAGTQLFFPWKISTLGDTYMRTEHDSSLGLSQGIALSDLEEIPYEALSSPRFMKLNMNIRKQIPHNGKQVDVTIAKGRNIYFTSKITINGGVYLRTDTDTTNGYDKGIALSALDEFSFDPLASPRFMEVAKDTYKKNVKTGANTGSVIPAGTHLTFDTKVLVNDIWYLRTADDTTNSQEVGIPLSDIKNIPYITMTAPRSMKLTGPTRKINPLTGVSVDPLWENGRVISFTSKIYVNGQWYLRSQVDTANGVELAIPLTSLQDL